MLEAIDDLHAMEVERRKRAISTPEFHRIAEDITDKSREVFRIAVHEERTGDDTDRGDKTIEDVDREAHAAPA